MEKTSLSILLSLIMVAFLISELKGQILAGEVPAGASIQYPDILLTRTADNSDTTTFLDIDQDGSVDVSILLYKGFPPADNPNQVLFYPLLLFP